MILKTAQLGLAQHPKTLQMFRALAKTTDHSWREISRLLSTQIHPTSWSDLIRSDSLTQHIAILTHATPQVTVRFSGIGSLFQHEAATLQTRHAFIREVILHGAIDKSMVNLAKNSNSILVPVYLCARTVCPIQMPLALQSLRKLKTTPLAKALFRKGSPTCYARKIAKISLITQNTQFTDDIYMRKSIYGLKDGRILVTEIPLWHRDFWIEVNPLKKG